MKQTRFLKEMTLKEKEELAKSTIVIQIINDVQVKTNSDGVNWLKERSFIFNNV